MRLKSLYINDWDKLIISARESRKHFYIKDGDRLRKSMFKKSLRNSPCDVTLIERSSEFGYDENGSKKLLTIASPHRCKNSVRPKLVV